MANKSTKQLDKERLEKSIPELFGKVARKLLLKEEDPFAFNSYGIESNGTVAKRTIRVLQAAKYLKTDGSYTYHVNEHLFNIESPQYAQEAQFTIKKVFSDIEDVLTRKDSYSSRDSRLTLDTSGQRDIEDSFYQGNLGVAIGEAIHVWWNRDDYVFNGGQNWDSCHEPKTVLVRSVYDKYIVAAARATVDVYVKHNLHVLLPAELGLSIEGSKRIVVDPEVPNFMHHRTFIGSPLKDLEKQYKAFLDVATSLNKTYQAIRKRVNDEGGLAAYITHLRKQAIDRLIIEAPIHVHQKDKEFKIALLSKFVLQNLGVYDYDTLYGEAEHDPLLVDEKTAWDPSELLGSYHTGENIKYQEILQAMEA